jgi:LmbE family N-acetylglucosaminyl deacetylase
MKSLLLTMLFATTVAAQPRSSAELAHALDRVATTGRVLYVAAHPDDENTRFLAYFANVKHFETAYVAMTRGGGGQNLIGGEQGTLLDVIRTEELLAARRIDGARQFFTRMRDFGYSKRADETLALWNHDEALGDLVRVIRTFQPDLVIARFGEAPPNHGHHTSSAILAREAFAAAADPKRFPEQLQQGLTVWQADRLYQNIGMWGRTAPPAGALSLEVNTFDPRFGLAMGEISALSRSQHKSQGFGDNADRQPISEYLVWIAGTQGVADPFAKLPTTWSRFGAPGAAFGAAIAEAQRLLDRDRPERALPALVRAYRALGPLPATNVRVVEARVALAEIIAGAAGVYIRPNAAVPFAAPGSAVEVAVELDARRAPVEVRRVDATYTSGSGAALKLAPGQQQIVKLAVAVPADARPSVPYWLVKAPLPGRYEVDEPQLIGAPRTPPALVATIELSIAGLPLELVRPVVHAWTDPVQGERERPFLVAPPATVTPLRDAVLAMTRRPGTLALRVRAGRDAVSGTVELALPPGWTATPARAPFTLAKRGDEITVELALRAAPNAAAGVAVPAVKIGGGSWSVREDVIDYPHLPVQLVLRPATVRVTPVDLKLPAGRIGYVRGSGDSIPGDLAHVGFTVEELDDAALRTGDLSRYTTIVLGIRAVNTRPAVTAQHERLMAYVARGGTLITQYVTFDEEARPRGPFAFEMGRPRITDETAAVTFLAPKDPLMTRPNALTAADFDGWVQERGLYFATKWASEYRPLFRFNDPGEAPIDGALIVAAHGKGRFIYTGLALFRQLPAGVPGAYRLFANLIAGGR